MKLNKIFSILATSVFLFSCLPATPVVAETEEQQTGDIIINNVEGGSVNMVHSEACMLIDADTGEVIYAKNPDERLYPASITKILTTYVAAENSSPTDVITHTQAFEDAVPWDSSKYYFNVAGETYSMDTALHTIMMYSANNVCVAVANKIDGGEAKFVQRMNDTLAQWGCTNTHFVNSHGYHDENHYTTARDMATITYHAIRNEWFQNVWTSQTYVIPKSNKSPETTINTKVMNINPYSNYYYEYAKGSKTGYHDHAANTLVTYGEKNGIKLIGVIMKDSGRDMAYNDMKTILEYGFLHCKETEVYDGKFTKTLPVNQLMGENTEEIGAAVLSATTPIRHILPDFIGADKIKTETDIPKTLTAPIKKGDVIGTLSVKYNDILLGKTDIVSNSDVPLLSEAEFKKLHKENLKKAKAGSRSELFDIIKVAGIAVIAAIVLVCLLVASVGSSKKKKKKYKAYSRNNYRRRKLSEGDKQNGRYTIYEKGKKSKR
ncbi:MAG: D-alanyl-D-alanine carboxypeptidase [Firmicutes bacterium]|nr:D-alanyl-D-alanine carboxypeptidase [Bacillota bacterium]